MSDSLIVLRQVDFSYGNTPVLENVNLEIRSGDFVAMIGPNGGGKTTLMKIMLGLLKPTRGQALVLGQTPPLRHGNLGYVPQNTHRNADFPITVAETVHTGLLGSGGLYKAPAAGEQVRHALERVGMTDYADRRLGDLSGGQRQRALIARALVSSPQILFLDEPASNIDPSGQESLYNLLYQLNQAMTIVVVSHDLLALSQRVKSVVCVNRAAHYHSGPTIDATMLGAMYNCPVDLIAHGLPHRVLGEHTHQHGNCCDAGHHHEAKQL